MSQLDVDKIVPQSGTSLQLGENGDTISVPAGATFNASAGTFTLPDGSVVEAKIANSAVTNDKLAGSIANSKLANSAITINGSSVSLGGSTTILTGTSWQSAIKTSTFTAAAGEGYFINTSGGAFEVDLPGSPSVGDVIEFVDFARKFATNKLTLDQGSNKFQGQIASTKKPEYNTDGQSIRIVYSGSTQGWIPTSDDDVEYKTSPTKTAHFLVIAGGGSGGRAKSGGGGAGGYRNSFNSEASGGGGSAETALELTPGQTYTVTVGGGASAVSSNGEGNNGNPSSISGTGITTITSDGGGGGGGDASGQNGGRNGGSGGGMSGGGGGAVGNGTANQGYNGGTGFAASAAAGGGGGGAGAVGESITGNQQQGGDGGAGVSSTITGSSVARGGGGAGTNENGSYGGGSGGAGGGGAGSPSGGTSGTANTGGGGGGTHTSGSSGAGGDGVVILRIATADYSGTTTGSPTVTTVGADKVLVFNGSGSYTA